MGWARAEGRRKEPPPTGTSAATRPRDRRPRRLGSTHRCGAPTDRTTPFFNNFALLLLACVNVKEKVNASLTTVRGSRGFWGLYAESQCGILLNPNVFGPVRVLGNCMHYALC